jgi:lipopolysaccharide biosynthesis glycosyltransferase
MGLRIVSPRSRGSVGPSERARPLNTGLDGRVRRLLGDLRRGETRGDALRRIRRRAVSIVRRSAGAPTGKATTGAASRTRASTTEKRSDSKLAGAWRLLAGAVLGLRGADAEPPDPGRAPDAVRLVNRHRAEAALTEAFAHGETLERAVCRAVRSLTDTQDWRDLNTVWAMAEGVGRLPGGATAAALGHAILRHRQRQFGRVWNLLHELPDDVLSAHVAIEAVDAALTTGTQEGRTRALAIGVPSESMPADVLVDLAGRFLAFDERGRAGELVAELRRRPSVELDERRRHSWSLIEGWLNRPATTVPPGSIPVAVMDYQTPDHVLYSGNLGDYVQSLALVGNLVRLSDVRFSGDDGLGELATELQRRVRSDLRLPDVEGGIHLVAVDREFSSVRDVPEGTWLFAFGWHMHPLYDLRYDFPYHPNLRPLFISFHVNRLDMLTDEALAYLREHGPVGCRDWTTVFLLLSAGIDAFFSGCVSTTVDALFQPRGAAYAGGGAVGVIDLPARAAGPEATNVRLFSHQSDDYRYMSATDGLRAASRVLTAYQRELDRVVTGRLHAYLPLTALGVPVEFTPGSPGDVRFAGLAGLRPDDTRLTEMRAGIRDLMASMLEKIVGGAGESEVYDLWRELTRDGVAEARARFEAPAADPPGTIDMAGAVATSLAAARRFGPQGTVDGRSVTDVVLALDQNLTYPTAVLIESMVANASGPLRLWILGRGLSDRYQEWLAGAFPALPITFLPCDHIAYSVGGGRPTRIPARITISTMDRLLLPGMLPDVNRVVYVDIDTLVLGDICSLARIDLDDHPIGARHSTVSEASEWYRAVRRLPEPEATELRRVMLSRHGYGHPALNAGVLVLDLDRMRRDDFSRRYLAWVERYGLNDQDTMLAYVGPDRRVIDPSWNALPHLEEVDQPSLIHWTSLGKPWASELTFGQDLWRQYAANLQRRAGPPPSDQAEETVAGSVAHDTAAPAGTLANPVPLDATTTGLSPNVERVIRGVLREHLSYVGAAGLRTLAASVEAIEADGIDGVIVEAGTARGGSAIAMAAAKSPGRPMKVYDVFGMIPPPSERDGEDVHARYATIVSGESQGIGGETYYGYRDELLGEVTQSFARHGLPIADNNVELVQGLFQDTIALDEPVALAHLDGDWYESTMTCLIRLAPLLAVGGRLVIDDYDAWSGCRAAVDEYFADRPGFRFERRGKLHIVRV